MKTRRLVFYALLIAMYVALCALTLNLGNIVISLASLPVVVAGLLYGPWGGLEVGLLGSFLNQLLKFGFTATTLLWIIPAGARGLIIGLYARKHHYVLSDGQTVFILILSALIVTVLNTLVMWADSVIYGYYSYAYIFGAIAVRFLSAIATQAVNTILVLPLRKRLSSIHEKHFSEND